MENTRAPLRCWCHGFWRVCSSKKGASAKQIEGETGVSYKTALFMLYRIRFALADMDGIRLSGTAPRNTCETTYTPTPPRVCSA